MAQTGKALSSRAASSPMAFRELSRSGFMAAPASEAEGEPHEKLLPIISTPAAGISHGEGRFENLGRSFAELSLAETGKSVWSAAEGCRSRRVFGKLSPRLMAELALEARGEPQEDPLPTSCSFTASNSHGEGRFANLWRRLGVLDAAAYAAEAELNTMKRESEKTDKELLVIRNPSQAAIDAAEIQTLEATISSLRDQMDKLLESVELEVAKGHNYRNVTIYGCDELDLMTRTFKQVSLKSADTYASRKLYAHDNANCKHDIMDSKGTLKDLACSIENIFSELQVIKSEYAKDLRYQLEASVAIPEEENVMYLGQNAHKNNINPKSDESSSTTTTHSDSEDELIHFLTETRQSNYIHVQPEDFSLPEVSTLDLPLQFPLNRGMSDSSSSSSSSSSSRSEKLDEHDEIYARREDIGIATEEEEEMLLAEASMCVADDLESAALISRHDEAIGKQAYTTEVSNGAPRKILLEQKIVFFAKERNSTSCSICINDFDTTDRCIRLPCKHIFHVRCIVQWLLSRKTCPVCRRSL